MFSIAFGIILILIYLGILVVVHQLFLPELNLFKYKKQNKPLTILSIFPHPDDETMNIGGTIAKYARDRNVKFTIVSVTKGEAGETNGVCEPSELGKVRAAELLDALSILGVKDARLWDFPDGNLIEHRERLVEEVRRLFQTLEPDVVITYDSSGLYGHPDHIILSQVVTELVHNEFTSTKLLYATLPTKIVKWAKLPQTINLYGKEVDMKSQGLVRTKPKYKSSIWSVTLGKIEAIKAHQSQNLASNLPIPLWAYSLFMGIEYFSEGN